MENALDELEWFRQCHSISSTAQQKLQVLPVVDRIECVLKELENWYFDVRAQERVSLCEPWLWYTRARTMRRNFVFHVGPTNSGKTHVALEALTSAKSGVYCAPLKALATQVFHNIKKCGVPCDLLIGDERRFGGSAEHVSCTVEMTPIDLQVDVGVIDEIQLIGDRDRGWAWTRALLGLPAAEIHLCGEARSLELVKTLLSYTGEIRRLRCVNHNRLVPLSLCQHLDGHLKNVENGDCLVSFSKKSVVDTYQRLKLIPSVFPYLVYGALPFSVRERQSQAFNDGVKRGKHANEKHVLVSTDAIAYGLNMNIRRIVLTTMRKFDGHSTKDLPHSTALQIVGRAGRFGQEFSKHGYATTLYERDFHRLDQCFKLPLENITTAGVLPTLEIVLLQAALLRRRGEKVDSLKSVLASLTGAIRTSPTFMLCDMSRSLMRVAECVDNVEGLSLRDKVIFSFVPMSDMTVNATDLLCKYASHHARGDRVPLYLDEMDRRGSNLEWMYRMCEVYCWLGWRFRNTFCNVEQGQLLKELLARDIGALI